MADFDSPMKLKFSNEVELAERVWELSFIVIIIIVLFSFIEAWGGDRLFFFFWAKGGDRLWLGNSSRIRIRKFQCSMYHSGDVLGLGKSHACVRLAGSIMLCAILIYEVWTHSTFYPNALFGCYEKKRE